MNFHLSDLRGSEKGFEMYELVNELFPICRSITGDGVRKTLSIIKKHVPLEIHEIPSGTKVFDWMVPNEWNIKDAYVKNSQGEKIIDFKNSNLHLVSYSIPVNKKVSINELKEHLHTIPEHPDWIPYRTSYYTENWGFCTTHAQLNQLTDDEYEVFIDSKKHKGSLTYGEFFLPGKSDDEVLFSCYICHPSMCNDNLSGIALVTFLAKFLQQKKLLHSYRFLFIPETIGAISWLYFNQKHIHKIKQGMVVTCVGDRGKSIYKKSRYNTALIDRIVEKVLRESNEPYEIIDFTPMGSDERQFSSPGFNLAIGSLMRSTYRNFPEYHTSKDDLNFITPECLENSYKKYLKTVILLENENELDLENNEVQKEFSPEHIYCLNLNPKCEPNLGKRGLYRLIGNNEIGINEEAVFWVLNYSDGKNSLLEISSKSKIDYKIIEKTAELLENKNLIKFLRN